ncbi:hypothetical protein A0J61_11648 [Choanephora cucurbitarum]|uniref:Uncharacterized protein n=1 Tax=Choanephora cucurbitarum TaxID=101091 RepID=A0A1C7MTZ5_9FUNG|nr:hypothetical protein A0J61_11648 [Choanephora cucurbitarum]
MSQNIKRIQNSTITINNYPRERSPTPESSNSSVSEPRIKRRKKLDYLVGEGAEQWEPSYQLIVNEINLTKRLKKLRDQSVDSAKLGRLISDVRIL